MCMSTVQTHTGPGSRRKDRRIDHLQLERQKSDRNILTYIHYSMTRESGVLILVHIKLSFLSDVSKSRVRLHFLLIYTHLLYRLALCSLPSRGSISFLPPPPLFHPPTLLLLVGDNLLAWHSLSLSFSLETHRSSSSLTLVWPLTSRGCVAVAASAEAVSVVTPLCVCDRLHI